MPYKLVNVDEELWEKFKKKCVSRGVTIRWQLQKVIEKHLKEAGDDE